MEAGGSAKRQRLDRVQINVGGTVFTTTKDTLTLNSTYFHNVLSPDSLFAPTDGEQFLDRDAEAFGVLLKCMRLKSTVPLPVRSNSELCKLVLMEAEYFGVEWLLAEVKMLAVRNALYPHVPSNQPVPDVPDLVAKFDERFHSVELAIKRGILPDRLLGPIPPATRRIKQLVPYAVKANPDWVVFYRDGEEIDRMLPICYALIEDYPTEGATSIEPIVVTRNPREPKEMLHTMEPENQLMTATDWLHPSDHGGPPGLDPYDTWAYEHVLGSGEDGEHDGED